MSSTPSAKKKIRIDHDAYNTAGAICSITIVTLNRRPAFQNITLAADCVDLLRDHAIATSVLVHAYCFMPDHVHLLLSPSPNVSIIAFVAGFKSLSTRVAWQHGHEGRLWQARFFDHFLPRDEAVERVVEYILHNPVRAGIVPDWRSYPFSGSLVYSL